MALRGIDPVTRNRFQSNAEESYYRNEITASEKTPAASRVYGRSCPYVSVLAFFGNRLESIRNPRIYSEQANFRLLMAELKISRTNCARSEVEIPARPTSAEVVGFVLEPKSFKIPPTKCQWGPIGHLYNLGLSMGSAWWPYGGRLSDPFFQIFAHEKK